MGAKNSCFRPFSSAERLPEEEYDNQSVGSRAIWVIDFLKPSRLWTEKDRKMQQKEQQQYQQLKVVKEVVTLEEWFLASPGKGNYCFWTKGGDYYVLKQLSNLICPSLSGDCADFVTESRDRVSLGKLLTKEEVLDIGEMDFSSVSKTESGKKKKRVTFKLPEDSDIIIFYSPEVDCQV